jgi:hypothetical protein
MSNYFKIVLVLLLAAFLMVNTSQAQLKYPRVSQGAKVTQTVGLTDVTIVYHRPGVKGRVIWGELVPYDAVWRTGANEATTIEFSTEAMIAGTRIAAGKYSLFTIPSREEWTVVINKNPNTWGAYDYKQEEDVLRFKVKPEAGEHQEWLIFTFENLSKGSVDIVMRWEKFKVTIPVTVTTDEFVLKGVKTDLGWQPGYRAAAYCLENNLSLEEGKKWIEQSVAVEKTYSNLSTKARYLALDKKYTDAAKTMKEALDLGQKMENKPMNYGEMEKLLNEWSKMK